MKNKIHAIAILICLNIIQLSAQNASIQGIITGEDNQEGLVGVNILLKSTVHGTVSGIHGDYILRDISAGKQTLIFSYIGYETFEIPFEFKEGELKEYNLSLIPGSIDLSVVSVEARQPFSAASSKAIRDYDLKIKPVRSAQDMLLLVPGLFIAQHAGGGKAEQIFLRGFDADHGTDVGISVDGLPINMVTHGHGQGYADLHFVIPEIIDGMTVFKGPYFSQYGNFGTAGSVAFTTTDHPDHNLVKLEGGLFNTAKATAVLKIPTTGKHQSAYLAGQYYHSDGPFESPQGFNRANIYGKFHTHITPRSELGVGVGAFSSAWDASGQIPQRAINSGLISRWGAIDDMEGGTTGRYNISVDYHFMEGYEHDFMVQAFVSKYDFNLYSNFTFWLNDSIDGDMIEQSDHRNIYGINTHYSLRKTLGKIRTQTRVGGSYRGDNIDVSLWKSPDRIRKSVQTDNTVNEVNMAFWLEEDLVFSRLFKLQMGLRGDYFTFHSIDHLDYPEFPSNGLPHASGYAQSGILSPKLNMVLSPTNNIDLYLNMGTGFHSNDARDVIIAQRIREIIHTRKKKGADPLEIEHELLVMDFDPAHGDINTLPRAAGVELGSRFSLGKTVLISLAGWYLHMEEELVFVGDEGNTEISGETRRVGLDAEIRMQLARWIWADIDLNLSDGRYINEPADANNIPLAPRITSQGGLNFLHPAGFEAALRYRYLGNRPANEDNSVVALGHFLNNIIMAYNFKGFRLFTQVENLFNITWNEAQFDTESRLFLEPASVSELHFTPGNPFNVQAGISFEF
jgi:outer membrane receptor protein involved in Fe transport